MKTLPHWSALTMLVAVAGGLLRRRAAADRPDAIVLPAVAVDDGPVQTLPTQSMVHAYAYVGCTDREIADRFGLAEAAVRESFGAVLSMARAQRSFALRRSQTDLAVTKANGPMLTWLGRNELGQSLSPAARGEPEPEVDG